jgi:aminoglycoside 6'-N-acetyltransferase I
MDRADHLGQPVSGRIARMTAADVADWARMRLALWPTTSRTAHEADIEAALIGKSLNLIARGDGDEPLGFAEASLRHDYVNGTKTSPVAFLEGIYVEPDHRGTGVARMLVLGVEAWARQQGCSELASDTPIDNLASQQMHEALGFSETQRVVFFRKILKSD